MKPTLPILLALFLAVACTQKKEPHPAVVEWESSQAAARRGFALMTQGRNPEAQVALLESYRQAAGVLATLEAGTGGFSRDLPPMYAVLSHLSEVGRWLGIQNPIYSAQSARLAYRAIRDAPDQPETWGVWGAILYRTGYLDRAQKALERHLSALKKGGRSPAALQDLLDLLLARGLESLARKEPGCEGKARAFFGQALKLHRDPRVEQSLARMNQEYQKAVNEAARHGDLIVLGSIHARNGFFDLAKENLEKAVLRDGMVSEIRWILASDYYEGLHTRDSLTKAARLYKDFIDAGERGDEAAAGWVRVKRRLGELDDALVRFGDRPDPSESLRIELILTRFDRILGVPEEDLDTWRRELPEIDRLLGGTIETRRKADLTVELGFLCLRVRDRDRLSRLVKGLAAAWPEDLRRLVLEGGLMDLRQDPIVPRAEGNPDGD